MDPAHHAALPNMQIAHSMNHIAYDNADFSGDINVFIHDDSLAWQDGSAAPYSSIPESATLFHDPSWNLTPHGSAFVDFPEPRLVHYSAVTPHSTFEPFDDTRAFTTASESLDDTGHLTLLTQYPSSETTAASAEEPPAQRARRRPRIENGYKCQIATCGTICHTQGDLTKHFLRKHTPESSWRFVCEVCGKRNYDKRDHGRHMKGQCGRTTALVSHTHVPQDAMSSDSVPSTAPTPSVNARNTLKQDRQIEEQATTQSREDNQPRTLDFYRADHDHDNAREALAAATSDLLRFINLRAAQIKIEAVVPCSQELITFTAVHGIRKVGASPLSRTPSTTERRASGHDADMLDVDQSSDSMIRKRVAEESLQYPSKKSRHPSNTSLRITNLDSATPRAFPLPKHAAQPHQQGHSPSSTPSNVQQNVAITLTIRQRPGFSRSVTHPGHIHQTRPSTTRPAEPRTSEEIMNEPSPQLPRIPDIRKRLKHISFTWPRIHLDRHIQDSAGLAWAKLHPGKSLEL